MSATLWPILRNKTALSLSTMKSVSGTECGYYHHVALRLSNVLIDLLYRAAKLRHPTIYG